MFDLTLDRWSRVFFVVFLQGIGTSFMNLHAELSKYREKNCLSQLDTQHVALLAESKARLSTEINSLIPIMIVYCLLSKYCLLFVTHIDVISYPKKTLTTMCYVSKKTKQTKKTPTDICCLIKIYVQHLSCSI